MKVRHVLVVVGLCVFGMLYAAGDAAGAYTLSRGRQIILNRGLQIQAEVAFPGFSNIPLWTTSNFTTLNFWTDTGQSQGCWGKCRRGRFGAAAGTQATAGGKALVERRATLRQRLRELAVLRRTGYYSFGHARRDEGGIRKFQNPLFECPGVHELLLPARRLSMRPICKASRSTPSPTW